MIEIFDLNIRKTAVLQNAYDIRETSTLNGIDTLSFSMPKEDYKNQFCVSFHYVRYNGGSLYRIIGKTKSEADTAIVQYNCEHVIATLIDDVIFGAVTYGGTGRTTRQVIQYLLEKQTVKRWVLDGCDFSFQYEYGWENENLLNAVFSVPNLFVDPYIFQFDTSVYPWKLSLRKIDVNQHPQFYVRAGKNLLSSRHGEEGTEICTRLYCLGYGEGVNQLTIRSVNHGIPYLQAPEEDIQKYGIISRIFVDRSFEDANSLMERGRALLEQYRKPLASVTVSAADLYGATKTETDRAQVGKITLLTQDETKTYITQITRNYDSPGNMTLTLASKPQDIAESIAELADRQRIESTYAQGSTQLYGQSVQSNATPETGAVLNFYIPSEMRIVNSVKAKITLDRFRSYSKSTAGGGGTTRASSDGGESTVQTTSMQQQTEARSTAERALTAVTTDPTWPETEAYTELETVQTKGHVHRIYRPYLNHSHQVLISAHSHSFTAPAHSHSVKVTVPAHSHSVEIPSHTHGIEQGIFKFGSPKTANISVNGVVRGSMGEEKEIDITNFLVDESDGTIPRGRWMKLEIIPDDLAYVTIDILVQGFIQSRGGSTL
ncbi:MAG: phage tail protein [Oscillospiraceae bacterium]|nr:phage tail protein [Oscillospiraceae bacterium]MDD7041806.1 phage tail protein [Oscillospiraceae bacterium]MDY2610453.1 phage tail protein [Oscillospiraceae bacterium]